MKNKLYVIPFILFTVIIFFSYMLLSNMTTKKNSPTPPPSDSSYNNFVTTPTLTTFLSTQQALLDSYPFNDVDINIIPDKYNTGATDYSIIMPFEPDIYDGIAYFYSGESDIKIDFRRSQPFASDIYISNFDFSSKNFRVYYEDYIAAKTTLHFENCIFSCFRGNSDPSNVFYDFKNCTFEQCYGSNLTLDRCLVSGGYGDGIVAYSNVTVKNSLISDKSLQGTQNGAGTHTDGVQIYGAPNTDATNIHFYNCRFELPQLKNSSAKVNSCIMFQMEYSNASDVSFENCRVNGGGYSIYARATNDLSVNNIIFSDIFYGTSSRWGWYCPCLNDKVSDEGITFSNINEISSLYISSVWSDGISTYLSVTNDTSKDRTLLIKTPTKEYLYNIPQCYTYDELSNDVSFSDYPFDKLITLPESSKWLVCYDITNNDSIQIRHYTSPQ